MMAHAGKGCDSGGISCQCWTSWCAGTVEQCQTLSLFPLKVLFLLLFTCRMCLRERESAFMCFFYHSKNCTQCFRKQNKHGATVDKRHDLFFLSIKHRSNLTIFNILFSLTRSLLHVSRLDLVPLAVSFLKTLH